MLDTNVREKAGFESIWNPSANIEYWIFEDLWLSLSISKPLSIIESTFEYQVLQNFLIFLKNFREEEKNL